MGFFRKKRLIERIEERHPTFGIVELRTENGAPLAEATLRDKSTFGAMIRARWQRVFPERINLWFPKEQIDVGASIRWSEGVDMGVKFDHAVELGTANSDRKDRIDVVTSHLERAGV
jgi:hypothetical protein